MSFSGLPFQPFPLVVFSFQVIPENIQESPQQTYKRHISDLKNDKEFLKNVYLVNDRNEKRCRF